MTKHSDESADMVSANTMSANKASANTVSTNNVHALDPRTPQLGASYPVRVLACQNGQAQTIMGLPGQTEPMTVLSHASDVPWLQADDDVLVLMAADGPVVTHRLRNDSEMPPLQIRMEDGIAKLEAPEGITLKSGQSEIQLMADGRIRLDGEDITQFGTQAVKLYGATVKLN